VYDTTYIPHIADKIAASKMNVMSVLRAAIVGGSHPHLIGSS